MTHPDWRTRSDYERDDVASDVTLEMLRDREKRKSQPPPPPPAPALSMKWSRFFYCAATVAVAELLITNGVSLWFTVSLSAFAAWWTFECTRALWRFVQLSCCRLAPAPSTARCASSRTIATNSGALCSSTSWAPCIESTSLSEFQ
jgi:hypothetical protein